MTSAERSHAFAFKLAFTQSNIFSSVFWWCWRVADGEVKAWSVAIGPSGLYLLFRTTDGSRVYTAHTATAFIQHVDMQHWKFPLCHDHIGGGGGVKKSSVGETWFTAVLEIVSDKWACLCVCVCTCFELRHSLIYCVHTLVWCQPVFSSNITDRKFMCEQACSWREFFWFSVISGAPGGNPSSCLFHTFWSLHLL